MAGGAGGGVTGDGRDGLPEQPARRTTDATKRLRIGITPVHGSAGVEGRPLEPAAPSLPRLGVAHPAG